MITYTIRQKDSNSGSIHDLASDQYERHIVFCSGCKYAVVVAAYYGARSKNGYTTHKTEATAIAASRRLKNYVHEIIDTEGRSYRIVGNHPNNDWLVIERGE